MKSARSDSARLTKRYRVDAPASFRLRAIDCADHGHLNKDAARATLAAAVKRLADLQELLYAEDKWSLLIVLQGMDAAGKDSIVAHVMSGVNPQGCEVHSFKAPSA